LIWVSVHPQPFGITRKFRFTAKSVIDLSELPGGTWCDGLAAGAPGLGQKSRADTRLARQVTKRYVYFWVDGIHVQARLEDAAQCLLLIIGATPEGEKELVGLVDGVRESAQSLRELLLDLKRRGLAAAPEALMDASSAKGWQ
jgi:hypothetical protein